MVLIESSDEEEEDVQPKKATTVAKKSRKFSFHCPESNYKYRFFSSQPIPILVHSF